MSTKAFTQINKHHPLETISIEGYTLAADNLENTELTLESAAMLIVTRFNNKAPLCIDPHCDLDTATAIMKKVHVRSALVSEDSHRLLGIIDSRTLESRRVLSEAYEKGIPRGELTVRDMMTPAVKLVALSDSDIRKCTIADVLTTLQHHGSQHILVVDTLSRSILGIISAGDIARALHAPVDINYRASNFEEVFTSLYRHKDLS